MAPVLPVVGDLVAGRYRMIEKLGSGGFGVVYHARQETMGRDVAIKFLSPEITNDPVAVERFRREAFHASGLRHPNTIILHDYGQTDQGLFYIVMELLQGVPLSKAISMDGGLTLGRALRIGQQILGSLGEAHQRGLVHRDLKPENIFLVELLGETDFVKVLDFGLSKAIEAPEPALTQAGIVFGTPLYMAPEQAYGEEVKPASDLFAFGLLLYEMLVGQRPFHGRTSMEVLMKLTQEPLPRLPAPLDDSAVQVYLDKLTEKEVVDRLQTALDALDPLQDLLSGLALPGYDIEQIYVGRHRHKKRTEPMDVSQAQSLLMSRAVEPPRPKPAPRARLEMESLQQAPDSGDLFGDGASSSLEDLFAPEELEASVSQVARAQMRASGRLPSLTPAEGWRTVVEPPPQEAEPPQEEEAPAVEVNMESGRRRGRHRRPYGSQEIKTIITRVDVSEDLRDKVLTLSRLEYRVGFLGRDAELRSLEQRLQRTARGQGGFLLVEGEAGVGKTRLLEELRQRVEARGEVQIIQGSCAEHHVGPGTGLREAIEALLEIRELGDEPARRAVMERLEELGLGTQEFARVLLSALRPGLAESGSTMAVQPTRSPLAFRVLERLLLYSARHKPLVLVLEDLHWADPFALGFAEHLVSSLTQQAEERLLGGQQLPLLCICTVRRRTVRERAELSRAVQNMERQLGRGFARLDLERLDLESSTLLLGEILPLDTPVLERILRLTQGNPLHLIQQVRYLATGQMLELGPGDRWRLAAGAAEAWPVDLKSLLHSRIEQALKSGAEAHNTIEITRLLCVLGSRFGQELLEAFFACLSRADLLPHVNSALGSLIRSGVLEHEPGQGQRYVFAHVLFYEALSEQLHTDPAAPSYHHAAALAKERLLHHSQRGHISMGWHADVARHWEAAGASDKAVEHRLEAARAAERGLDLESARGLYRLVEHALAAEDVISPLRISAQLSLGTLHLRLGELGPAEDILRRAAQLAKAMGDVRSEGRALNVLGRLHTVRSGHKEALRAFRRAASCFKRLGSEDPVDVALWAEAQLGQAEVARLRGELHAAEGLFGEALERAREARARAVEARCLYGLGKISHVYGRLRDALSYLQGAHDLFEECELGVESASVSCDLGLSQLFTHGRATSESTIRRALEVVDNAGERLQGGYARLQLGLALRRSPRLEEARAFADEAHRIFTRLDNTYGLGKAILLLGELDFLGSNLPAARQRGQAALKLHEQINDTHGVAMSLMFLGIWEMESGHGEQAQAHLNLALNMYNNSGIQVYQPLCMLHLGRLYEQQGQLNQAYKHYLQAQQAARQAENREALAVSMACLGGLSLVQGRLGQARGYFQSCLEISLELDHVDLRGLALFGNAWIETLSGNVAQRKRHLRDLAKLMRACPGRDFYFRERLAALAGAVSRTRGAQEAAHYRATALEVIQQISAADA